MKEREWQRQVLDLARICRWTVYHTHDSRHSQAGFPDLVLVRPPRLIFAELKTVEGQLTPDQRWWLASLLRSGQEATVWRPPDLQHVADVLTDTPTIPALTDAEVAAVLEGRPLPPTRPSPTRATT